MPSIKKDFRHVRKATIVRKPGGQTIKLGGYRPDKVNSKDKTFHSDRFGSDNLPPQVDLRPYMTRVENQGQTNSCTANAMAGAYEYLVKRLKGESHDVSRLFIYYNARDLDGDTSQDQGTYLRSCIKVLKKYGACTENTWPFAPESILDCPHDDAYNEGQFFLIEDSARVEVDVDAMRSCLAEGYPFAFGLQLFGSFQKAGSNGLVAMPDPDQEQHDGGHAMLCVGYSDPDKVFIVRNSWGEDWGDQGYCYIPYAYMTNPQLNGDCWTVRQISGSDVDLSENIQGDSGSLFSGAMAEIAANIQVPGIAIDPGSQNIFDSFYSYDVSYEEQEVYQNGSFISVSNIDDIEALYYEEYSDEYDDSEEEYEEKYDSSEEYDDSEETEDSYEESEDESEDEYEESEEEEYDSEEYEESEETEDSYEESEDEYEEDDSEEYEESEETEDSYEESEYEEDDSGEYEEE